uniref:Secreted protein n=1 Tax=Hippocampus comes TaxID=109280 RepID=A0A3Q2XRY1_HIPCM
MPAVFILLRSLVIRLLSSSLVGSLVQSLRRSLSSAVTHLGTALRHVWERLSSQETLRLPLLFPDPSRRSQSLGIRKAQRTQFQWD